MRLTQEEAQKFIDSVKGKKIIWNGWISHSWFTPNGIYNDRGDFDGHDHLGRYRKYSMCLGIAKGNWSFVEEKDRCEEVKATKPKTVRCECGKEKHNFASHSDWCPKFERWT